MAEKRELDVTIKALDDVLSQIEKVCHAIEKTAVQKAINEQQKIQTEYEQLAEKSSKLFLRNRSEERKFEDHGKGEMPLDANKTPDWLTRRLYFMGVEFAAQEDFDRMSEASALARANVTGAANRAMEEQLLSLVETGRFSTKEFGKIITQQVKMELVGLAAKAAVYALYETAAGLAASTGPWGVATFGNPAGHFAAATGFAAISGATLTAAAGVQTMLGGQKEYVPPGSSTGASASARSLRGPSSLPAVPALPLSAQPQARPEKNITVNIYNPISGKDVREAIVDIINDAGDMNYKINAKIIEAT